MGIYILPNDYPYTCEDINSFIKKYNGVCLTESFSPHKTGVTFSTWDGQGKEPQHLHGTTILFGKSGRFTFPECKQEDSPSSSPKAGFPWWVIVIIVIFSIAVIHVICYYCCYRRKRNEQNPIQSSPSPETNHHTANLHPIEQNAPVYQYPEGQRKTCVRDIQ